MSLSAEIRSNYNYYENIFSTNLNGIYNKVVISTLKSYQPREDQFIKELALKFPSDLLTAFFYNTEC